MKHDAIRKAFERDVAKGTVKKKANLGGRPRNDKVVHADGAGCNNKYLTYEQAKLFVAQAQYVTSTQEYKDWVKVKGFKFLPLTPTYVYREDWEGWNIYLGAPPPPTPRGIKRLPYPEAKSIAQRLAIKYDLTKGDCQKNWFLFCDAQYLLPKEERELPAGIPRVPQGYYDEWEGWPKFLGKGLKTKMEQLQMKSQLLAEANNDQIAKYNGQAVYAITAGIDASQPNLIKVIVNNDGLSQLIATANSLHYDIVSVYIYDKQELPAILDGLTTYGTDKGDSCFLIHDMQGLLSTLSFDTQELPKNLYLS